jgi:transposase
VVNVEQLARRELLVVVVAQAELIEEQTTRLSEQAARIEALTGQVAELQRRLGQNSRNSSLPPSSDRFVPPKPGRRDRSGRKPGKQPGAPGATLELVEDPDEVIDHVPGVCGGCGGGLSGAAPAGVITRQVHDVPLPAVRVVEHRMHKRACGCGTVTTAEAPAGVDGPACYGPNLRAVAVYLVVFQHVPVERAALLIADLCAAAVSTGWVCSQVARTAEALAEVEKLITTLITLAAVIGVDETTVNVAGDKQWLHVARTDLLTAYYLHQSRGRVAVDEFGVLPDYRGTVVHDALAVYDAYPATHALCGAHLIRELTAVAEAHPQAEWPAQARSALAVLAELAQQSKDLGLHAIPPGLAAEPVQLFRDAVRVGLAEHRRAPGRKQSKARNLLERLRDREPEILRFATDVAVPFTNNGSQRDLRPVKTQLKISGCHRAATGATAWLRIRGYISTVRKHRDDVLTALRDAITGNPWQPPQPAPT